MRRQQERRRGSAQQVTVLEFANDVCACCRERERKLEARNTAIQLSAEELEKRLQIKVGHTCDCF